MERNTGAHTTIAMNHTSINGSYTNYNQLTKEFYEIEDYELNVPLWLERVLDRVQDEGDIETTWENYGTKVPLII